MLPVRLELLPFWTVHEVENQRPNHASLIVGEFDRHAETPCEFRVKTSSGRRMTDVLSAALSLGKTVYLQRLTWSG